MKRCLSTLILLIFFISLLSAQNIRNAISLELTGGASPLTYKTNFGDRKAMAGTSAALKYHYNLDWNWSIGLGAEVKMYQSSVRFDTFADSYQTTANSLISGRADIMTFSYSYKNLEERQRALYINIPIYAQYRFDNGVYLRLGAKVGLPVKSKSEIYFEQLTTNGYFEYENITYNNLPQHGFGTYYDTETEKEYDMNINASLCAELGWTWEWSEQYILYLGVHGEYGFCNLYKQKELTPQLQYEDGEFDYTPVWSANIKSNNERVPITGNRVGSFAIGLIVRYSFGF